MTTPLSFSIITLHDGLANNADPVMAAVASVASQQEVNSEHLFQHTAGVTGLWNKLARAAALSKQTQQYTLRLFEEKTATPQELLVRAMQRVNGDIVGFLNPDEEYLPGALAAVERAFQGHPEVDLFITVAQEKEKKERIVTPLFLEYLWTSHEEPIPSTLFFRASLLKEGFALNPEHGERAFAEWLLQLFQAGKKIRSLACATSLIVTRTKKEKGMWRDVAPLGMRLLAPWWRLRYRQASRALLRKFL